jgi:hypothetical protein
MKCMAARVSTGDTGPDDVADIRFPLDHLEIDSVDKALEIVCRYYPAERVPPRTQFLLEELLEPGSFGDPA